jgi:CheY-like chemotaxis protein
MNHQYRILLVEDEPLIQFVIVDILSEVGFEVSNVVSTAAEALREIERGRFDAAIVDCTLTDGTCDPLLSKRCRSSSCRGASLTRSQPGSQAYGSSANHSWWRTWKTQCRR